MALEIVESVQEKVRYVDRFYWTGQHFHKNNSKCHFAKSYSVTTYQIMSDIIVSFSQTELLCILQWILA